MAKNLRDLAGRDLALIGNDLIKTLGTVMYLENPPSNDGGRVNYFFVPYDRSAPFQISSKGKNKVTISRDRRLIFSNSSNPYRVADDEELEYLAYFEAVMDFGDPLAEIQGRGSAPLIKSPIKPNSNENYRKSVLSLFGFAS